MIGPTCQWFPPPLYHSVVPSFFLLAIPSLSSSSLAGRLPLPPGAPRPPCSHDLEQVVGGSGHRRIRRRRRRWWEVHGDGAQGDEGSDDAGAWKELKKEQVAASSSAGGREEAGFGPNCSRLIEHASERVILGRNSKLNARPDCFLKKKIKRSYILVSYKGHVNANCHLELKTKPNKLCKPCRGYVSRNRSSALWDLICTCFKSWAMLYIQFAVRTQSGLSAFNI